MQSSCIFALLFFAFYYLYSVYSFSSVLLKGVESNEPWLERPSVIHPYARILFPKIVENTEFPHSYKKDQLPTSIGYHPATLAQERMDF